ncbi:MAG: ABC-F family ATP-binding cassette domain-containing protein [Clostridia bacterium]|nr:ABC-F family ATP-binding cassette domain-containing protein [Clostridia bacterium]
MSLLEVENLSHTFEDKQLYKDSYFELNKGEHLGVVGQNGTGKSTLIKILLNEILPDTGTIKWQHGITIGNLDQYAIVDEEETIFDYLRTAFADLYEIEEKLNKLYEEMAENYTDTIITKVSNYQEMLDKRNFYAIDSTIQKVASGLGIKAMGMETCLKNLSGGQRAKVILAKLLLQNPEVLILDEPTNFLDKEHVEWLSEYLKSFKGAFIIVSHDYDFLENITDCICDIEFCHIRKYKGSYSSFLKQKELHREEYVRQYESQQKEIKKLEDYIAKNRVRASTAKMAQSRIKKLDKIERMDKPTFTAKPQFRFNDIETTAQVILEVNNLEVGYRSPLLPKMNFDIRNQEKIVITGFNGIGKSTLLKTLMGELKPISGNFRFSNTIKSIGYYEQDLKWENPNDIPLDIISRTFPKLTQKQVRKNLADCAIKKEHVMQPVATLSGGEQAKVKLCKLILKPCNLLILDEPTNHLDVDTKDELREALRKFKGTVILVSHEGAFYEDLATRVVSIEELCNKRK